jgi:hypothetical protein
LIFLHEDFVVRLWFRGNAGRIAARGVSRGSSRQARALRRAGRDFDSWRDCGSARIFIRGIRWYARIRIPNEMLHEEARHKARALRGRVWRDYVRILSCGFLVFSALGLDWWPRENDCDCFRIPISGAGGFSSRFALKGGRAILNARRWRRGSPRGFVLSLPSRNSGCMPGA